MNDWAVRPLDETYAANVIDANVVKVRDGQVANRPFYEGWCCVQRLALGHLVEAEHHRPRRWIQVHTNNVDELLLKPGIVADLERVDLPRFEVVIKPRSWPMRPYRSQPGQPTCGCSSASNRQRGVPCGSAAELSRPCPATGSAYDHAPSRYSRLRRFPARQTGNASDATHPHRHRTAVRSRHWPHPHTPTEVPTPAPLADAATMSTPPSAPSRPSVPPSQSTPPPLWNRYYT
jgi:hypothetical protein